MATKLEQQIDKALAVLAAHKKPVRYIVRKPRPAGKGRTPRGAGFSLAQAHRQTLRNQITELRAQRADAVARADASGGPTRRHLELVAGLDDRIRYLIAQLRRGGKPRKRRPAGKGRGPRLMPGARVEYRSGRQRGRGTVVRAQAAAGTKRWIVAPDGKGYDLELWRDEIARVLPASGRVRTHR